MLEQAREQWRYIVTAIILVAIAAGALAAGVSVLAQGQGEETTRQPAGAAAVVGEPAAAGQDAAGQASTGVAQPQGEPTPRPPMGATYHTVASGETVGTIAAEYGLTTAAIANANGLANPNLIRVGQRLIIPAR